MRILYIHQYFKKPSEAGGTRSYWIAKQFLEQGHTVTMLTSKNNMEQSIMKENFEGIELVYLNTPYDNKMSILKRAWAFFSFMIRATYNSFQVKNVDVVYATSTPLTIGIPALFLKRFRRISFVFEVRDLWPEVPIQMGGLKNPILQKIAVLLEKRIYKKASHIIALSPGMEEGVRRFEFTHGKTSMVPNMAKIDKFYRRSATEDELAFAQSVGLQTDKFNVVHFGAMGLANGLEYIIEAAKIAQERKLDAFQFVFLGEGSTMPALQKMTEEFGLKNVSFLGKFSMKETSTLVNLCAVSVVSFRNLDILKTNSPNKLFDSLAAGIPIVVNSSGWTKNLVEENQCGLYADPEKPAELIEKLIQLKDDEQLHHTFGLNARKLAETVYDKSILTPKIAEILQQVPK